MSRSVLVLVLAALVAAPALAGPAGAAPTVFDASVPGFAGHVVPVTVYLAADAPAPTLLWGHGWAGSRGDAATQASFFAANGYNVVAMDFRGHGAARGTSVARVHDVDAEIKDVSAVIDWIAQRPWAQLDAPGDPTLGALGGSYGGGYQLLTAAFDDRLDAIAPEITWNSLPQSLAPNGGIKSAWVDLLYFGGSARANLDPLIHQAYAWAMSTNDFPDGSLPGEPDVVSLFERNSPKSYASEIDVPTFLIQGTSDTLFNLNEALANRAQIQATGAQVKLMTHLGGHIVSTQGTVPGGLPSTGLQPGAAGSPCGSVNQAILQWYDHTLRGAPDTLPDEQLALDDGTCLGSPATVTYASSFFAGPLAVPQGAPLASGHPHVFGSAGDVPALRLPLDASTGPVLIDVPVVRATVHVAGGEAIVYFSIVATDGVQGRIVNGQVTPLRLGPGTHEVELDLGGIGTRLGAGETAALQVSSLDLQYAQNGQRLPGVVVLERVTVTVPTTT